MGADDGDAGLEHLLLHLWVPVEESLVHHEPHHLFHVGLLVQRCHAAHNQANATPRLEVVGHLLEALHHPTKFVLGHRRNLLVWCGVRWCWRSVGVVRCVVGVLVVLVWYGVVWRFCGVMWCLCGVGVVGVGVVLVWCGVGVFMVLVWCGVGVFVVVVWCGVGLVCCWFDVVLVWCGVGVFVVVVWCGVVLVWCVVGVVWCWCGVVLVFLWCVYCVM